MHTSYLRLACTPRTHTLCLLSTPLRHEKARHIGVSNFNAHDLMTLSAVATEPIEVLEAHFGVGLMDFEVRMRGGNKMCG